MYFNLNGMKNIFPSTKDKLSLEVAVTEWGWNVVMLTAASSLMVKGRFQLILFLVVVPLPTLEKENAKFFSFCSTGVNISISSFTSSRFVSYTQLCFVCTKTAGRIAPPFFWKRLQKENKVVRWHTINLCKAKMHETQSTSVAMQLHHHDWIQRCS